MFQSVPSNFTDNHRYSQNNDPSDEPRNHYEARCRHFAHQRDEYNRRSYRNANINLSLFVAIIVCVGMGLWQGQPWWYLAAAACAIGFIGAVARHTWIDGQYKRYAELWAINNEGLLRLKRDWKALPLRQPAYEILCEHLYATDLDIVGHASLQHLLGTPATPAGQTTLLQWLLAPAPPDVVRARQAAVAELAPLVDLRDELALQGRELSSAAMRGQAKFELFVQWAEGPRWLHDHPALIWISRLLPIATIAALIADLAGWIAVPIWVVGLIINYALLLTIGKRVDATIEQVAARQGVFRAYAELFRLLTARSFHAQALQALQQQLSAGHGRADEHMRRLGRIMAAADFRFFLLFFPINLLTLWNFHVLWWLERWQGVAGTRARGWLQALGEVEALAALATLHFDHPAWVFPEIVQTEPPILWASSLGHPLLPSSGRVDNDVSVGPPSTLLLVTGSNMSGKSTLLRSIGINVVLAQAGGPVCASGMRLPPLALATSMRVQDSLEQGVSYFMAELQRLKIVVDAAQQLDLHENRTLLYLLDEILHGTNSTERQIAARHIIRHLLAQRAIGAVSTHDLQLAEDPAIAQASHLVHFREQFTRGPEGATMRFDYTLRPGLATSTNALKLMEIVGLPLDEPVDQH